MNQTPESPSATIRRAAKLMRERAQAAPGVFPWRAEGRNVTTTQDYDGFDPDWDMGFTVATCMRQDEAEHIASWHPLVALAVAEWLDDAAQAWDEGVEWDDALDVAQAYLGLTDAHLKPAGEVPR